MLTQIELAAATGLGMTQFRKYLAMALNKIEANAEEILPNEEILILNVNGKPTYHPIVLEEIQQGIKHVRATRYSRAAKTRRNLGQRSNNP